MHNYNDDIEKYLSGKLTPAERHRLEMRALSDHFLAEALEGAEALAEAEFSKDLDQIHQKITKQKRSAFFWPLRIAAGVILIGSITVISVQLTKDNNQIALQKETPVSKDSTLPPIPDPVNKDGDQIKEEEEQDQAPKNLPNQPNVQEKQASSQPEGITRQEAISSTPIPAEQSLETAEPIQEATDDKIELQQFEPSIAVESKEKKMAEAQPNRDQEIAAPSAVRSMPSRKADIASGASVASDDLQKVIPSELLSSPTPIGGFPLFSKYMEGNLRYPQDALNNSIQGDVVVEFQINANGSYGNFTIISGLGHGCNEEAIRLIKEGPKWNPAIKEGKPIMSKARVTIPFHLKK